MTCKTVLQLLPDLNVGGVERGTLEIAAALVNSGHRAIVISNHGDMVDELTASGAEHISLPIGKKAFGTLRYVKQLRQIIHQNKVDIVHARSRLPAWIGALAIKGIPHHERPRWVTTVHGPYSVNGYSRIMLSGEKIIAISEFIRHYITNNYPDIDHKKIQVIHRGVDDGRYHQKFQPSENWLKAFRQQPYGRDAVKRLIFAGRLTRWKGQADFIDLMAKLRDAKHPVVGLVVGSQSDKNSNFEAQLRHQSAQLGLSDCVHFLGNRTDLRELFSQADVAFSLPNIPEAFGRTTLEALSLGTPVIGYDEGGTGEILRYLFPEGCVEKSNREALFQNTVQFLESSPPVAVNTLMTTANMQAATLELYESLMAENI